MLKKFHWLAVVLLLLLHFPATTQAQLQSQLYIASGGAFSDPDDYVEVTRYDPLQQDVTSVNTIFTQAVQDLISNGESLFITATDSLVKIDLSNNQKLASCAVSGANLMLQTGNEIFMSVQYPESNGFVRVYDQQTLEHLHTIEGISGETAGMIHFNDLLYVAVPGGYGTTTGSLAIINPTTFELIQEINLGTEAKGIYSLLHYKGKILCMNKTPYGETTARLTVFDPESLTAEHFAFDHAFGKAIHLADDQLYLIVDNGLGVINLDLMEMLNPQLIPDPGSTNFIYFADIVYDTLHQQFYATTTDYYSFGQGTIYDIEGAQKGSFEAGISAEALAVVVKQLTSLPGYDQLEFQLYPNPFGDQIFIKLPESESIRYYKLFDLSGKLIYENHGLINSMEAIHLNGLNPGYYMIELTTESGKVLNKKLLKQAK